MDVDAQRKIIIISHIISIILSLSLSLSFCAVCSRIVLGEMGAHKGHTLQVYHQRYVIIIRCEQLRKLPIRSRVHTKPLHEHSDGKEQFAKDSSIVAE